MHIDSALLTAIINGAVVIWTAHINSKVKKTKDLAEQNAKDIDGVAIKAGTTRALARLDKTKETPK